MYLLAVGVIIPTYTTMWYYFNINVAGLSEYVISITSLFSYLAMLIGIVLYSKYLSLYEFRTIMALAQVCILFGSLIALSYSLRLNSSIGLSNAITYII